MTSEKEAKKIILDYTKKKNIRLVERGNLAIFLAFHLAKRMTNKTIALIPDQGAWISFEKYPKLMGLKVEKIKTDNGLINLRDLKDKLRLKNVSCFIITSLAGYYAEQEMKKIKELCDEYECILIEDATGIVSKKVWGDIIVGSFGHWKPVNLGYGGFIATDYKINLIDDLFSLSKTNFDYKKLIKNLKNTPKRIEKLEKKAKKVKKKFKNLKILHPEKKGLNVVVKFNNESEKRRIIEYCKKEKLEYVECPKNIRVLERAISIEIKRLD